LRYNPPLRMTVCRFLVLAIALIVPLQGMAAVAAAQCMALGHHKASGHESHGQMQAEYDHAAHQQLDEPDENSVDGSSTSAHCSPCTACCASASIAGPLWPPISPTSSDAEYLWPELPPLGVLPRGLDRPPLSPKA
jgi:hypothetical protein